MKGVQCYELFGGIALKIHTFSFSFHFHFLLLLLLSGTLFQMMSGVPHHCHHLVSFEDIPVSFSLQRLNCILDHCAYVHGLALS